MKTFKIELDGDCWCATSDSFVDLQTSNAGFGKTPVGALADLLDKEMKPLIELCSELCEKQKSEDDLTKLAALSPEDSFGNGDDQFYDGSKSTHAWIALKMRKVLETYRGE